MKGIILAGGSGTRLHQLAGAPGWAETAVSKLMHISAGIKAAH